VEIALRTQQIIAFETGVANTIDPLAGSYFVESMTNRLEKEALDTIAEIDAMGGVLEGIERGYFQQKIADAAYRYQLEIESKRRIIVGVNEYSHDDEPDIDLLKIDPAVEREQVERLEKLRAGRDAGAVDAAASELKTRAEGTDNLMPAILGCARAGMTIGEIVGVMKDVFGEYREKPIY
jgi:methylmalonyl-CoA mutase N-terminal domain/subunit